MALTFDLDPCAPVGGVPWIPVKKSLSEIDNGLLTHWNGLIWLNPPYGDKTPDWLRKMHFYRNGVALVFARTDCLWFHDYIAKADAILYLKGRIKFIDGLGKTKGGGAGCGSMLVAWGMTSLNALRNMRDLGLLVELNESDDDIL